MPNFSIPTQPMLEQKSLNGIAGWLLLFCLVLISVQPLLYARVARQNGSGPIDIAVAVALGGLSLATGIAVLLRWRSVFRWLVWYFAVNAVLVPIMLFASFDQIRQGNLRAIFTLVRNIVLLIAWVSYFKKSKRVRATFGRNL